VFSFGYAIYTNSNLNAKEIKCHIIRFIDNYIIAKGVRFRRGAVRFRTHDVLFIV